jgi:hypothetical protein
MKLFWFNIRCRIINWLDKEDDKDIIGYKLIEKIGKL